MTPDTDAIEPGMAVVGSDGVHVGTVERADERRITLVRDQTGDEDKDTTIPTALIESVVDVVRLFEPAADIIRRYGGESAAEGPYGAQS